MKISFIISSKFIEHPKIFETCKSISYAINKEVISYIEENITRDDIAKINNTSAVYVRHKLSKLLSSQIKVPIFIQHECPHLYYGTFNNKYIYLTDKLYMDDYPKAEIQPQYIELDENIVEHKKYDVLFVGNSKVHNSIFKFVREKQANILLNDFTGGKEGFKKFGYIHFIQLFLQIISRAKYYRFIWERNLSLREKRRKKIIEQLCDLSESGFNICIVGDDEIKKNVDSFDNVAFLNGLEWSGVEELMRESKITICTTPLHTSILNERYTAAIKNSSIPLYEPYPQYLDILSQANEWFCFDYKSDSLINKIIRIIQNYDDALTLNSKLRQKAAIKFSKENMIKRYKDYIEKYS